MGTNGGPNAAPQHEARASRPAGQSGAARSGTWTPSRPFGAKRRAAHPFQQRPPGARKQPFCLAGRTRRAGHVCPGQIHRPRDNACPPTAAAPGRQAGRNQANMTPRQTCHAEDDTLQADNRLGCSKMPRPRGKNFEFRSTNF